MVKFLGFFIIIILCFGEIYEFWFFIEVEIVEILMLDFLFLR